MRYIAFILVTFAFSFSALGQPTPENPGKGGSEMRSTPPELVAKAAQVYPEPLAKQVQDQIARDLQVAMTARGGRAGRSIATFFLADEFYDKLRIGRFENVPTVIWNGYEPKSGSPRFVYEGSQFAYVTSAGRRIVPGTMDTDGGSIPKILHSAGSFTPWGYGPAFIIHDWLFVAHKCGNLVDSNISFEDGAVALAEAIKTLMEAGFLDYDRTVQKFPKKEDTLYLIYQAVKSDIALDLWRDTANVTCRKARVRPSAPH